MQKLMKRVSKNKKGFTLIELIIVIVILAIIALLVIPRMIGFQDQAIIATCQANQRVMESAEALWVGQQALAGTFGAIPTPGDLLTANLIMAGDESCPGPGGNFTRDVNGFWNCTLAAHN